MKLNDSDKKLKYSDLKSANNIASLLDDECLAQIGMQVVRGYEIDEQSRAEWKSTVDKAMDIAKQVMEPKTFPWPGASNIKFPLIARASIDYAARTLPEIIQNEKVVKASVVGADPEDIKYRRASRVSQFMSYKLISDSPDWEDGTDKLLQILPILGTVFKKTYYSDAERRIISELCVPDKIVINYDVQSLETARRITHVLTMYTNDIIERQRRGMYLDDVDVQTLRPSTETQDDDDFAIELLEQHCWLDLDEDGYKEPYIVTVHKDSRTVLRIVSRFKSVEKNKNGDIVNIKAEQYFTDYHFIRSPDGGFYSMGFGSLLLPLNRAINSLINLLIDSGTLSNIQGGFLGRGLRLKNGEFKIKMGEWKVLDAASGTSIKDNIFPIPVREPSQTLYQLLGLLIQIGQDLSSTTDVLSGKQPAQNVTSNTISQLVEQGTKVFTAINKRVYRSLKKEYQKCYELYSKYLTQEEYVNVLDDPEADVKKDFELNTLDIHPVADPSVSSESQRLSRANMVQSLRTIDVRAADTLVLQSLNLDQTTINKLLPPIDPNAPPPPEAQKTMAEAQKLQAEVAKISADATLAAERNALDMRKLQQDVAESDARINEAAARTWKMQKDASHNDQKLMIVGQKSQAQEQLKSVGMMHKIENDNKGSQLKALDLAHKVDKENAEVIIKAKEVGNKIPKPIAYDDKDIRYTAKLKGIKISEVKKRLGVE